MKKVHIQILETVHTRAKVISVLKEITLNEYFEQAIAEAIKKDKDILDKLRQ
ncbi:MAG: hypothetical protein KKF89_04990 [Nanoarchaeota archaeon]|nr:hypothetical protein [Nanoarchaeota archaeon]MBU1855050.1 hypothetical protein [Nanoarchaeota archaeon]